MGHLSKRIREIAKKYDKTKVYNMRDAIAILKSCPTVKFDQSVEVSLKMGVDPRKSDQAIRATVSLPNGTGKQVRILVFAKGEKVQEALAAGANYAGNEDLLEKVGGGWTDFDAVIATPEMMREVGKLGKILGPRGLMPTPKAGTVTTDISKAIQELQGGKIEFRLDKHGLINSAVGKLSFDDEKIEQNIRAFLIAVQKAKPPTARGQYIKSLALSSTMGPGIKLDQRDLEGGSA
ncbi:MAG: 50S ribosomal protein L1 [Parachlamydiaceae bacterium]|nr:50S ribosomal protein L1 [Parachlamydiaceae bacterium]